MNSSYGEILAALSIVINSSILIGVYTKIIERISKLEAKMEIIMKVHELNNNI